MASAKLKFAILLCLATIFLCEYLCTPGFRICLVNFQVLREFPHHKSKTFVKEVTTNRSSFFKRILEESNKHEKLTKHNSDAHRLSTFFPEIRGNVEAEKNVLVKSHEEKNPGPIVQKGNSFLSAEKNSIEEQRKTDIDVAVKNKENVFDQKRQFLEGEDENLTDIDEKANKRKLFSEAELMNGEQKRPVNPHDFNYLINEPNKCKNEDNSEKNVFMLVLIFSVHVNFERRNAIRRSWGSPCNIDDHEVITMFLLARQNEDQLQKLVLEENEQYHDIVMEDFVDTYNNLTLKTIMGMKWMSTFCAQAKFMMKTDDDMYVSYANIVNYLDKSPKSNFVTGHVLHVRPIRDPRSKWYVSTTTYPDSKYPPYCSGGGYILSGDVPSKVYTTSLSTPYFFIEDVYVGICLDKLHIIPEHNPEFHNTRTKYTLCLFRRILTTHGVAPRKMIRYWEDQTTNRTKC